MLKLLPATDPYANTSVPNLHGTWLKCRMDFGAGCAPGRCENIVTIANARFSPCALGLTWMALEVRMENPRRNGRDGHVVKWCIILFHFLPTKRARSRWMLCGSGWSCWNERKTEKMCDKTYASLRHCR